MTKKMEKHLVIVESPAKSATIKKYLGENYEVKASYGHVSDLPKKNMGVDVSKNFAVKYEISPDKKKVITELKKAAKEVDTVWIATDEDREWEAIGRHVANALGLDIATTPRIVFHEITKDALQHAVKNPRKLDLSLVDAQQARRVLDRLVWFELSPVLWKKIKPGLSAGRVQSVAVRLITEKEKEILAFASKGQYKTVGYFSDGKDSFPAELNKKLSKKEEAMKVLEDAKNATFTVSKVETKPGKKSSSAPFTTSTLQQEASRKLWSSVSRTMSTAQKLYEAGLITYMRTDSVNLSDTAMKACTDTIISLYGKEYSEPRKYKNKSSSAQEAHECIRPTDMNKQSAGADASQKKLYELIWKRTIASQMTDAAVSKTQIDVAMDDTKHVFVARGEIITFDGFLKVYSESQDDDNGDGEDGNVRLPNIKKWTKVNCDTIIATEKFTRHPARYTEASLVKKLEEEGIGRPSTYAPTISTIQQRWYVIKQDKTWEEKPYTILTLKKGAIKEEQKTVMYGADKNKLFPTDMGLVVTDFLVQHFPDILDYSFTASVEKDFDNIAAGKKKWTQMLKDFYDPFHALVENTWAHADRASGERHLGTDPKTGKPVIARLGRFGPMVQIGSPDDETKPQYAPIRWEKWIGTITLEEALELFALPKKIGEHEGHEVQVSIGRFGPYIKFDKLFVSVPKDKDVHVLTIEEAIMLIQEKQEKEKNKFINQRPHENDVIQVLNGQRWPYIKRGKKNYKIPKTTDAAALTKEEALELIAKSKK
jgi:DNA topoisomerase-1